MKHDYQFFLNGYIYDVRQKQKNFNRLVDNTLNKTNKMFVWHGLPETIPADILEKLLQTAGFVAICDIPASEKNPGLYVFTGNMSGNPNRYYLPSVFTVSNPALTKSYNFKIVYDFGDAGAEIPNTSGNCILAKNDSYYRGLLPIIGRYTSLIVETDITIYMADVLTRTQYAISAGDETTRNSAEKFIADLTAGKMSVIGDNVFIDSLKTLPLNASNGSRVTDLIELEQYLRGSMLNDLGLDANYNMKRERLQADETQTNKDGLTPLIENMLDCRQQICKQFKTVFDVDVSVELADAWKHEKIAMLADIANDVVTINQMPGNNHIGDLTDDITDSDSLPGEDDNSPQNSDINVLNDSSDVTDDVTDDEKKEGD